MLDDATKRQLRFSLFLQSFALLMLGGAAVVRVTSIGWDGITLLFIAGVVLVVGVMVFTVSRLRAG